MLVEIHGADFKNKGAQLMLETVVEKLSTAIPNCTCCVVAGKTRPPSQAARLGVQFIWPSNVLYARTRKFWPLFHATKFLSSFVPTANLEPYGLVKRSQISALIDISGFAFSDIWGPTYIKNFSTVANYYHHRNCPVLMLPQMFGPFENAENKKLFKTMTSHCTKIYARDSLSFDIAKDCASENTTILQAPDITLFQNETEHHQSATVNSGLANSDVIFVPNIHVLDRGSTDWDENSYLRTFSEVGQQVLKAGKGLQIVVHETFGKDAELAEKIRAELQLDESSIFTSEDPSELKAKISSSCFLFGSRFHSLAAALSTATPVVSIGWAHKYGQLLSDFGVEQFDIKSKLDSGRIPQLIQQLLQSENHTEIVKLLKSKKQTLVDQNQSMWDDVIKTLKAKASS